MLNNKKAFTLIELLIAMLMVAILSVMLIPNIVKTGEKETFAAQLPKVQNDIQQALLLMMSQNSGSLQSFCTDQGPLTNCFIDEVAKNLPAECKPMVEELVLHWNDEIEPVEGMADLLKELKEKGYKLYLLSNASYRQPEYFNRTPGHEYFDGRIVSFQVKQVKPDKEIYESLYKTYNLNPKECYFIDDLQVNIYGGMKTGMDGYVFDGDVEALRENLKSVGVL